MLITKMHLFMSLIIRLFISIAFLVSFVVIYKLTEIAQWITFAFLSLPFSLFCLVFCVCVSACLDKDNCIIIYIYIKACWFNTPADNFIRKQTARNGAFSTDSENGIDVCIWTWWTPTQGFSNEHTVRNELAVNGWRNQHAGDAYTCIF